MQITPTFLWVAAGLVLVIAEMFSLTLVLLFFGIAALLVALTKLSGLDNFAIEVSLFAVLGLASMLLLRKKLRLSFQSQSGLSVDHNVAIPLNEDIPAQGSGQVHYQGVVWIAVNPTENDFKKGNKVFIQKIDGVKLILASEPNP